MSATAPAAEAEDRQAWSAETLLEVRDLSVEYLTPRGPAVAVDEVSFTIRKGEVFGLVGARYIADRILVLYAGHLVEAAESEEVMAKPLHPYTQLLLSAVPDPAAGLAQRRVEARGEIPTVINPKPGCRFANRCPHVMDICRRATPALYQPQPGHRVRCYLYAPEGAPQTVE